MLINTNQHQLEPISINQNQSASISFNQELFKCEIYKVYFVQSALFKKYTTRCHARISSKTFMCERYGLQDYVHCPNIQPDICTVPIIFGKYTTRYHARDEISDKYLTSKPADRDEYLENKYLVNNGELVVLQTRMFQTKIKTTNIWPRNLQEEGPVLICNTYCPIPFGQLAKRQTFKIKQLLPYKKYSLAQQGTYIRKDLSCESLKSMLWKVKCN